MKDKVVDQNKFSAKRAMIAIFFISLAVRVVFVLSYDRFTPDTEIYDALALNMMQGFGYTIDRSMPHVIRPPLYSFFLATLYSIFGYNSVAVKLAQALIGSITVIFVYKLGRTISGRERIGLISALVACFYPELVAPTAFLQAQTLTTFLLTVSVWLLMESIRCRKIAMGLLGGILLALTTLSNTTTLILPAFLFVGLLLAYRRKWFLFWLTFSLGMIIAIAPWTIRNYVAFKVFIPVTEGIGGNIWTVEEKDYSLENTGDWGKIREWMIHTHGDTKPTEGILDSMRRAPKNYLLLCGRKFVYFWSGVPAFFVGKTAIMTILYILHYLILILFIIGFRAPQIRTSKERWILIMVIVYFTLIQSLLFPVLRYRILITPFVLVFAGSGIARLFPSKGGPETQNGEDFSVQRDSLQ